MPTHRQVEVLAAYIAHGSQKAAAWHLGRSEQTVRNHLSALRAALDVDCLAQAAYLLHDVLAPIIDGNSAQET